MLHAALLVLHLHAAVQQRINVSQAAYSELHPLHPVFLSLLVSASISSSVAFTRLPLCSLYVGHTLRAASP